MSQGMGIGEAVRCGGSLRCSTCRHWAMGNGQWAMGNGQWELGRNNCLLGIAELKYEA